MAVLNTNFLWSIVGKNETGEIPDIIIGNVIKFNKNSFDIRSATIQFLVDSVKVSEFILQVDRNVFFEERLTPIVGASNQSFKDTVNDLNKWVAVIDGFLQLPKAPQANFKKEIEKDDDEVTAKFILKAGNILLFDAKWDRDSDTLDFGSRVEAVVPWADFLNYIDVVNKFVGETDLAKLT